MVSSDLKHNLFWAIHIFHIVTCVWCNCVYVCETGIYVLRTYRCLWGRTFLKNYRCGRTFLKNYLRQNRVASKIFSYFPSKKIISVLIQMPKTYLCESVISCLCEIKSHKRNSLTHSDLLIRGATKKDIIPRFGMLVDNTQQQKSHSR